MRGKFAKPALAAIAMLSMAGLDMQTAAAATTHPTFRTTIELNGKVFEHPNAFVYDKTTYMPIWYVQQVLKQVGISNNWNGSGALQKWTMTDSQTAGSSLSLNGGNGRVDFVLNGKVVERGVTRVVAKDSGTPTTYVPIWYVQELLRTLGITNTWNGNSGVKLWTLTYNSQGSGGTGGSINPPPTSGDTGVYGKVSLQNVAANDTADWNRADENFFLSAQTNNPNSSGSKPSSATSISIGQKIYLFAYAGAVNINSNSTSWTVNSSYATVTRSPERWHQTNGSQTIDVVMATFTASKPGIYTVQAQSAGNYSVPLAITVGLPSLKYVSLPQPIGQDGITALTGSEVASQTQSSSDGATYSVGDVQGQWIPVFGVAPKGVSSMTVLLETKSGSAFWDYSLPVTDGRFGAVVESPFAGQVWVEFNPYYLQQLNANVDLGTPIPQVPAFLENFTGTPLSSAQGGLLASAKMDFNMVPSLAGIAASLMENSPSTDTGIEAINNWVANDVRYNYTELQPGQYLFQDSLMISTTHSGVCEDYAELEASMLRSIGIPVETITGNATPAGGSLAYSTSLSHEWLKVWDGKGWVLTDPTWSTEYWAGGESYILNQFFTATTSFTATHTADLKEVGQPY